MRWLHFRAVLFKVLLHIDFFFRIQYSPSNSQILWIKLMVRSSWKKKSSLQSISQEELCVLCCCRIKQLKQIQNYQFKKIYYCWSIFFLSKWTKRPLWILILKSPCSPSPIHAGRVFIASLTVWEPWKQDHKKEAFSSCRWPPELPLWLCLLPRDPMTYQRQNICPRTFSSS